MSMTVFSLIGIGLTQQPSLNCASLLTTPNPIAFETFFNYGWCHQPAEESLVPQECIGEKTDPLIKAFHYTCHLGHFNEKRRASGHESSYEHNHATELLDLSAKISESYVEQAHLSLRQSEAAY